MAPVTTIEELHTYLDRVKAAQLKYATYTQEQVDRIFVAAATAVNQLRVELAVEAATESGMGLAEDKVIKNHFAAEYIVYNYRNMKTCDIIEEDPVNGFYRVAEPLGVIAGVIPCTNPTSTCIYKCLLALKTRNAIVFSPHPRTKGCTCHTAKIIHDAAVAAGAPEDIIGYIDSPTIELSGALMKAPQIASILATGGPGMVGAAYSSGKPALGVGAGNTPAIIDETADIPTAVSHVLMSKDFDHGVICASEQHIVVVDEVYDRVKAELLYRGAYLLNNEEREAVAKVLFRPNGALNADIVGQAACTIAKLAGVTVPEQTKCLVAEVTEVGAEPFSREKLSPTLGMYRAANWTDAIELGCRLLANGGIGHTAVFHTNTDICQDRIDVFARKLKAGRLLVDTPASQGAIGDMFNFRLPPALTLGAGSWGGNSVSENIQPKHLLNIKSVACRRENMLWLRMPDTVYHDAGCLEQGMKHIIEQGFKKFFVVTDPFLAKIGYSDKLLTHLKHYGGDDVTMEIFGDVLPDPTLGTILTCLESVEKFQPDCIIGLGGGSPIDAAKIVRLMYECPRAKTEFSGMNMRFLDIRKRVYEYPELQRNNKSILVCVPTTSGTGTEVTPFSVVTDEKEGVKYPLADYSLTPQVAVIDGELCLTLPPMMTVFTGMDVLTHAVEAYVSILASDPTSAIAMQCIKTIFKWLPRSVAAAKKTIPEGAEWTAIQARQKVHNAAALAGVAFSNAFLGIVHSLAHKAGQLWHVPHGLANAIFLPHCVRFQANDCPYKMGVFPQYRYPQAVSRFAEIARELNLEGETDQELAMNFATAIEKLAAEISCPMRLRDCQGMPDHETFLGQIKDLAVLAFDDQCTGASPVTPLFSEMEALYANSW